MLYVVATPIGNLADMSPRARDTLATVDLIAAEDTRRAKKLLHHLNIHKPLLALHAYNEQQQSDQLIAKLLANQVIALITDAGTPLISDPGLTIVRLAHQHHIKVVPIPGPCALITALSAAGIAIDRFSFEGFLPAKAAARKQQLTTLQLESRTIVFYEAPHRIVASLTDMAAVFGGERYAVLARELTKMFETIQAGSLAELLQFVTTDPSQQQGEIVLIVSGATTKLSSGSSLTAELQERWPEAQRVLTILQQELPLAKAASVAAKILGMNKKELYDLGLSLRF